MVKTEIKRMIKKFVQYTHYYQRYRMRKNCRLTDSGRCVYCGRREEKVDQLERMIREIRITIHPDRRFQHWIDTDLRVYYRDQVIGNMPPDYRLILNHSLNELIANLSDKQPADSDVVRLLMSVDSYIERILSELHKLGQTGNIKKSTEYFERMKTSKADSLEEALQRILFWSSLFWQSEHKLVGLGRLDKILDQYCFKPMGQQNSRGKTASGMNETDSQVEIEILKDFLLELHDYYEYKSNTLLGDIGQIIILGGLEEDGNYFCGALTYKFIDAVYELQIPDPKLLLRCSANMPRDLLELAIKCISTGVGSPLLSNDEVVIPSLLDFGYSHKDAYNYVTSACWEPVSYGNSLEQNNLKDINFAIPFVQTMQDESVGNVGSFEEFLEIYLDKLRAHIKGVLAEVSSIQWEADPLFSLFTENCVTNTKDISQGGAVYNDYGILSVGMGNAVNSLLNVKDIVYDRKLCEINDLAVVWKAPEEDIPDLLAGYLKDAKDYYGHDGDKEISLTNQILEAVENSVSHYRNKFGGKVKFGLSSPGYVDQGMKVGCTFDGRGSGDPLMVHISAKNTTAYTELISFASQIHYTGWGSNANVVDFFVSADFIKNNLGKFTQFIMQSIRRGFFQMQMNVVSSATLIAAKKDPEKFPNLIVRVWGFSAYFKDLPDEYKNVLISRALASEGNGIFTLQ